MAKKLSPTGFTKAFRVLSASPGRVDFEMDIHQDHTNRLQTLHGGTLASLVDLGGSLAVASTGRFATGVSTDLNVTYLAPGGRPGDLLRGTAVCDKNTSPERWARPGRMSRPRNMQRM
ncbi:esterase [Tolypocladium capitatum]|uniref:Esterase n=1 Tax=Tolypocladium capitatum TaxID=45235 RepID=A0A2K3Q7P3_9HYPO|nr:esterase [Tolypocladium capitatum]